ncbi:hypothetical protein DMENIID0001_132280 [Sergentomyia squamirostris]
MGEYSGEAKKQKKQLQEKIDLQVKCNHLKIAMEIQEREMKILRRCMGNLEERMETVEIWIGIQNKELEEFRQKQETSYTKKLHPVDARNEWSEFSSEFDPEEDLMWYYDHEKEECAPEEEEGAIGFDTLKIEEKNPVPKDEWDD